MWRKICKAELQETRKVYFIMFAILLAAGILSLVVMGQTPCTALTGACLGEKAFSG